MGKVPKTKSLTFAEIRDKFGIGSEGLSNRTLNRYTSSLAAVFKWAEKRDYWSGENPFAGQFRKVGSQRKAGWLPFTDEEVATLLKAAAEFPESDAMRWVPLIGAYSGMRSNEICTLRTTDSKEQDGVHFFDETGMP